MSDRLRPAAFLDRDGTVVRNIYRPWLGKYTAPFSMDELWFAPGVLMAMSILDDAGYLRILITNQPDVSYGWITREEWGKIQKEVIRNLRLGGAYFCRHRRGDSCYFRKPNPGMILAAAKKWGVDLAASFIVGDTDADTGAGKAAGCRTILIEADFRVPNILEAAKLIRDL